MHVEMLVQADDRPGPREILGVRLWYRRLPSPLPRLRDEPDLFGKLRLAPAVAARRLVRSLQKPWMRRRFDRPQFDRLLARLDADVYCCFGVHQHAASVIHTAAKLRRPSVLFLASDTDLTEDYRAGCCQRNAYGQRADVCHFALTQATVIVAQTGEQQMLLRQRFARPAPVIRNPIAVTCADHSHRSVDQPKNVLWIGRADCFSKRADLAIELASRCPSLTFTLIMNPRDSRVYRQLIRRVPSNTRVVRQVPWQEINTYFESASILINTSEAEGFPNTFLQAAQHGVPIVSRHVDPDAMLTRHGCGIVAGGSVDQMVHCLENLSADEARRNQIGRAGQRYVREYHEAEARCDELSLLLQRVVAANRASMQGKAA
jgi:glycosyltransferase involved in cell wall biosynthesis